MELSLKPGETAFILNVITDVLAIIAGFCLVKTLNSYGRWKLYHQGMVPMDMHFHDMSFAAAALTTWHLRSASRVAFFFLCTQTVICALVLILRTVAPIGISESKNLRVQRNHTVQGEAHCLGFDVTDASTMIGVATERVITHFEAGGSVLRVGRTGRNQDALIMEDEERSLGQSIIIEEWSESFAFNISAAQFRDEVEMDMYDLFKAPDIVPSGTPLGKYVLRNVTHVETGMQITEGPLYIIVSQTTIQKEGFEMERYAFARCIVPRTSLLRGDGVEVNGNCTVANLERNTTQTGVFMSITNEATLLLSLDEAFQGANMSTLGQRCLMAFDVADALSRAPCSDTYVAYLPLSEVSASSITIVCTLGIISFSCLLAAIVSHSVTSKTFDWNGSYEKVISLAVKSISTRLTSSFDSAGDGEADLVVEQSPDCVETPGYHVHVVPRGITSYPVPNASPQLIQ